MNSSHAKFVQLTNNVVFDDLWRRSNLSLRDRSLVTIAALAAMGNDDQLDLYLRRGLESGLTRNQITEALTHLGFYAGWPKATKAMSAVTSSLGTVAERFRRVPGSRLPDEDGEACLAPHETRLPALNPLSRTRGGNTES